MVHETVIFHFLSTCWPRGWPSHIWPSWTDLIILAQKQRLVLSPKHTVLFTIYLFLLILEHNMIKCMKLMDRKRRALKLQSITETPRGWQKLGGLARYWMIWKIKPTRNQTEQTVARQKNLETESSGLQWSESVSLHACCQTFQRHDKTSGNTKPATQCHIPDSLALHQQHCENLKSHKPGALQPPTQIKLKQC